MDGGRVPFLFVNFARLAAQLANGVKLHGGDYCNFLFKKLPSNLLQTSLISFPFFYTWPSVVEFNGKAVETVDIATLKYNPNR